MKKGGEENNWGDLYASSVQRHERPMPQRLLNEDKHAFSPSVAITPLLVTLRHRRICSANTFSRHTLSFLELFRWSRSKDTATLSGQENSLETCAGS
jgi:hypothetical protein